MIGTKIDENLAIPLIPLWITINDKIAITIPIKIEGTLKKFVKALAMEFDWIVKKPTK